MTSTGRPEAAAASAGSVGNVVTQANAETGGARLSFELDPQGAALSELRARHGLTDLEDIFVRLVEGAGDGTK